MIILLSYENEDVENKTKSLYIWNDKVVCLFCIQNLFFVCVEESEKKYDKFTMDVLPVFHTINECN